LSSVVPPTSTIAKIDNEGSGHFFTYKDELLALTDVHKANGPTGILPDQSKVKSEIKGNLPVPGLSAKGQEAYGFKGITNSSLILVAKL
jgi:hypothetical protein